MLSLTRTAIGGAAALCAAAMALGAQEVRPGAPDTIAPVLRASAPLPQTIQHSPAAVAGRIGSFRYALTPAISARLLDSVSAAAGSCAITPQPGRAPRAFGDYLVASIVPDSSTSATCGGSPLDTRRHAFRLYVDGVPVAPAASVARAAWRTDASGNRSPVTLLDYYYPMSVVRLQERGTPRELALHIWPEGDEVLVRDIDSLSSWRLAYAGIAGQLASAPRTHDAATRLEPARPVAPAVGDAMRIAASASTIDGALAAAVWLSETTEPRGSADDRAVARMLVAEGLLRVADSAGTRAVIADADRERPCLRAPRGASTVLRTFASELHGPSACETRSTFAVARAAMLFPGLGHAVVGKRAAAVAVGAIATGLFMNAARLEKNAQRLYTDYQNAQGYQVAPGLYGDAELTRGNARHFVAYGLTLWVADAAFVSTMNWLHNRTVRRGQL